MTRACLEFKSSDVPGSTFSIAFSSIPKEAPGETVTIAPLSPPSRIHRLEPLFLVSA